jgi:glycosyltransferase involved in cell wall biosynthesis
MDRKKDIKIIKKKILIFIPAYNVEKNIFNLVKNIPEKIFKKNLITLLIVNDKSVDDTISEIKKIKKKFKYKIIVINNKRNAGYGGVQKIAYNFATSHFYDFVIMLHGDGQYKPKKIPMFIKGLGEKNISAVFGSRMWSYNSALKGGMPIYKLIGNIFLTKIQNFILGSNMSEFHSGYRSYKVSCLKRIKFNKYSNNFHFDTEIIIGFLKENMNIKEIPIPTVYKDQISHLKSIPYGLNVLRVTFKSKFNKDI